MASDPEDDEYRPRADDHLVEPFFAGLGAEEGAPEPRAARRGGCGGAALLVVALALLALA